MPDDPLARIVERSLALIEQDVQRMDGDCLDAKESHRLVDYLRVLVPLARDKRQMQDEAEQDARNMTDEELRAAVLAEAERLKQGP